MRVFKTRWFDRWARKVGLSDVTLVAAVDEMEHGLVGDALGGYVFKKRVAMPGKGKRGGSRVLVVYRRSARAYFVYGFKKSERANIGRKELLTLRELAADLFTQSPEQEQYNVDSGALIEVTHNG